MAVHEIDDANQLYGRMMECCDIEVAIVTGHFKSLDDVLMAVKTRAEYLNKELSESDFYNGNRSVPVEEFELIATQHDANLVKSKH